MSARPGTCPRPLHTLLRPLAIQLPQLCHSLRVAQHHQRARAAQQRAPLQRMRLGGRGRGGARAGRPSSLINHTEPHAPYTLCLHQHLDLHRVAALLSARDPAHTRCQAQARWARTSVRARASPVLTRAPELQPVLARAGGGAGGRRRGRHGQHLHQRVCAWVIGVGRRGATRRARACCVTSSGRQRGLTPGGARSCAPPPPFPSAYRHA